MMLKECKTISDIFEFVKSICYSHFKREQAGLMVGLADLGLYQNGWVGAYYSLNANSIVLNEKPIKNIPKKLQKPYLFYLLLHEYIHSLGFLDEEKTKQITYDICLKNFGEESIITKMSRSIEKYVPGLMQTFSPPENPSIEFMPGIDRKNTNYIG
jgi:hypothetical protein